MKPEPKIGDVLTTGTKVKVTVGVGEDGEVYLLDEKSSPIGNGHGGYKTASPAIAEQVKTTLKRAAEFGQPKPDDFIHPDPASIPDESDKD